MSRIPTWPCFPEGKLSFDLSCRLSKMHENLAGKNYAYGKLNSMCILYNMLVLQ